MPYGQLIPYKNQIKDQLYSLPLPPKAPVAPSHTKASPYVDKENEIIAADTSQELLAPRLPLASTSCTSEEPASTDESGLIMMEDTEQLSFCFNPISVKKQENLCEKLKIPMNYSVKFVPHPCLCPPTIPQTYPNPFIYKTLGDGRCCFRALSFGISGTEDHWWPIQSAVLEYIRQTKSFSKWLPDEFCGKSFSYINHFQSGNQWGTETELLAATELFDLDIFVFCRKGHIFNWIKYTTQP